MPRKIDPPIDGLSSDEVPAPRRSPRKENTASVLRRSTRKRSLASPPDSVSKNQPQSAKKSRKTPASTTPPTLLTLPDCTISRLLLFLDVTSLENLSATCYYFDQMIAGRFLMSINLPFPLNFIKEVMNTDCVYKKPLLRLRCKKTREEFKIFSNMSDDFLPMSMNEITLEQCPQMRDYMVLSQMSLLSLDKVREVDLVPESFKQEGLFGMLTNRLFGQKTLISYISFDFRVLGHISRMGSLSCVTRLDVLVDEKFYLEEFMSQMPNLLELGLTIMTKTSLRKNTYLNEYLTRMEAVVTASKAPVLKVTVKAETKRQVNKVFKNSYVEKLVVAGPCTFNVFPVMKKLKEVVVTLNRTPVLEPNCTYWKAKSDDRVKHRAGLCCVNMGAVYKNCPKVEMFMGVEVGMVSHKQSFNKWNNRIKMRFHEDYLKHGGSMDMKAWAKARWYKKCPVLPKETGHDRVF